MVGREGKGRELGEGERDGGKKGEGGSVVVKKTLVQATTSKLALKVVSQTGKKSLIKHRCLDVFSLHRSSVNFVKRWNGCVR